MADTHPPRPEFRNIHALTDLPHYRMPLASVVSILHRISGAVLFLLLPLVVWLFDKSLTSEVSFETFRSAFAAGIGPVPLLLFKLVVLALLWAFFHHALAGLRHVIMDATHRVSKEQGRNSAIIVLVVSLLLTLACGAKLFGLY